MVAEMISWLNRVALDHLAECEECPTSPTEEQMMDLFDGLVDSPGFEMAFPDVTEEQILTALSELKEILNVE